jgi:predicted Zn-dependent peptidase
MRYGDFTMLFSALERCEQVTNEDIKRVVDTYLKDRRRTVVTLVLPKAPKEAADE